MDDGRLARRLGVGDAVVVGLGAMLGAGVFAAVAPAARAAGSLLLVGLVIATAVAYCNATASAHLAALMPEAGGTYVYARERLGEAWGFLAGWGFIVGKAASCATMAMTFGAYAAPGAARPLAVAAVVAVVAVNLSGIERTAQATRVVVALVLLALAAAVVAAVGGGQAQASRLDGGASAYGVLQSAGLLFFAFAGYARIATLAEEVRDPARTIPRAVPLALGIVLVVYATVALAALLALGPERLAASQAPLADAARAGDLDWLAGPVRAGGAVASLGVLLSLVAGVSRTTLAMARRRELPGALADVRGHVPARAEVAVGVLVIAVVLAAGDVRDAIGFSSFTVLAYYALANASAWTLRGSERRRPRALDAAGVLGCAALAVTLPVASVAEGAAVLAIGLAGRRLLLRRH